MIGKQGGPGKVTEWVNTRHVESSKFMDGKIQGIEASLAKRKGNVGLGASGVKGNTSKADDDVVKDGSHFFDEFKLKPNVKYETNGYLYQTDELGRIKRASGELTLEMGER
ncbi:MULTISPECIES: DNA/RNA non-specific endonuclease [unclassified Bacillus (in: firmicutes)]|uniref:DNA/RNA non-specific endonuclease n=1 Tax=unclassified Bacillus (in: firmicutes) TaxID=185979 RepID=UPI0020C67D84|nr:MULTISPECIES: DNA/RNA non-specific endonuclease [unclassified Bacillus (in: firmicutes)]